MTIGRFVARLDLVRYTFRIIARHPLTRDRRRAALGRWLLWQIGSRLVPGPVAVPFVDRTRLLAAPGMHGATLNIYVGLADLAEMGFLLHLLRPEDLFVDVGASTGAYAVLASGVVGCRCIAFEPSPAAFDHLCLNVRLNDIENRVACHRLAVGSRVGSIRFTTGLDTLNHVALPEIEPDQPWVEVGMTTLDASLAGQHPALLKIDVEGFESSVISGAEAILGDRSLQAIIIELGGGGARYGAPRDQTFDRLSDLGFAACDYDPWKRHLTLIPRDAWIHARTANTIFVRDLSSCRERTREASPFTVLGRTI